MTADQIETLYANMPRFGLGAAVGTVPRSRRTRTTTVTRVTTPT